MTTFTNIIKHSSVLLNSVKNSSVLFTNLSKVINRYLLKEDGYFLLLENGGKIYLDKEAVYTNSVKN